ncbi:RNA polymerase sigma factor [Trebonia kvetii]|uniref:RNA polymerase sigma factor n=1 Tax=Trebonia kvetii TaxID=2480626 RepID=UPI00248301FB|nr:sigma-70 family RNA polymerase sigma factor [Trebonia kvetii]
MRTAWWPAAAAVARLAGDLSLAEDCAQEACAAAVEQWPREGWPANPGGWVVTVARRRALDHLRRESTRPGKEREAVQEQVAAEQDGSAVAGDDQLALLFACCHPALDPAARVTLTLRVVCGLPVAAIARVLLLPEPAIAQRIVRAKRKIRDAGIRLRVPGPGDRPARLASVLRAVYLTFTEGHSPQGTGAVVRDDLSEEALRLARSLHRLLPGEPEVTGLLALILLTSARSAARADQDGALVLLADQDRSRWDQGRLDEGRILIETALAQRRPGPYQLQAAIAACHADAARSSDTDWRQIAALYGELLRFDPSPVIEANRAVAVAYAEGPAAGLAILDTLAASSRLARWQQLHIARAAMLARCGRREDAVAAYRDALALEPADAVRQHITSQITALAAAPALTEET